jgi:4-hydroxy-3-methylbut-2-enyl diphosphate reductase
VGRAQDIAPELLVGVRRLGVTAGASAPESLVQEVVSALEGLGSLSLSELTVAKEEMRFNLPPQVRARPAGPPTAPPPNQGG